MALVQDEPAPVTVTVPIEPEDKPIKPNRLLTAPPFWIVSVPVPVSATERLEEMVQVDPGPVTVTVPVEPRAKPIRPLAAVSTTPPFWIVSVPVPELPTKRFCTCAPGAPTTVALGVIVSIFASIARVGSPADQLPALNQSVEMVPVQLVCARAGVTPAPMANN